jgi:hypothetical protein
MATLPIAWGMRTEIYFPEVQYSDTAFHLAILNTLDQTFRNGGSLFDFWFESTPFGFALFRSYQYLPYEFVYLIYRLCGGFFSIAQVLIGTTVLLTTLFPVFIFFGLRLLHIPRIEAACAALAASLISDGGEYGFGLQNFTFGTTGILTQLWAMMFLPFAVGYFFQFMTTGKRLGLALLFSVCTFGSHVVAAFVLFFFGAALFFGFGKKDILIRTYRVLTYGFLLFIATAHQWFFILQDSRYINPSALEPRWKYQGRGFEYLWTHLIEGQLFDNDRFPVLTVLLFIGVALALTQPFTQKLKPKFLVIFVLFFTLCSGREIWGFLLNSLPVLANLHVHRFAVGVHFSGVILIGYALATGFRFCARSYATGVLGLFFIFLILRPAYVERSNMYDTAWVRHQYAANEFYGDSALQQVLAKVKTLPYGWIYTGASHNWQSDLKIAGFVPLDVFTTETGMPTAGGILYHAFALAGETLFDFDINNPAHFNLYGITSIIAPYDWKAPLNFSQVMASGKYSLWSRPSARMFIGDSSFIRSENLQGQTNEMRSWVANYKTYSIPSDKDSRITVQQKNPLRVESEVSLIKDELVVISHGFHPNWNIKVDGIETKKEWISPGFIGVMVPQGNHKVSATYEPSKLKPYLVLLSMLIIAFSSFLWGKYLYPYVKYAE